MFWVCRPGELIRGSDILVVGRDEVVLMEMGLMQYDGEKHHSW